MPENNSYIKSLLIKELGYLPDDIDLLLSRGALIRCHKGEVLIECGKLCDSAFIVKSGIMRFVDMNGDRERTFAFALPGTLFFSKHSFVMKQPSYYQVEACCDSELLEISCQDFWNVAELSHDISLWLLKYAHGELFCQEYKNAVVHNGSAAERYRKMLGDRPEIIENVSQKIIASYLGVTPEYLSKLKGQLLKG